MAAKRYPQFLLLGDSLVQYTSFLRDGFSFGAGLAEHCQRRLDIVNKGLSGYNTANELVILQDLVPSPSCAKIDYLLVLFGANDSCLPDSPSRQHVPLKEYRANIKTILTHPLITAHSPTILLVTPPPINEVHLEEGDLKKGYTAVTRHQIFTVQYANVIRELAVELKDQKVVLVDLWSAMMKEAARLTPGFVEGGSLLGSKGKGDSEGFRQLLVDGLHFTGAGYKIFLDEVLPLVGREWADEPLDNPSWIFPHWSVAPRIDQGGSQL